MSNTTILIISIIATFLSGMYAGIKYDNSKYKRRDIRRYLEFMLNVVIAPFYYIVLLLVAIAAGVYGLINRFILMPISYSNFGVWFRFRVLRSHKKLDAEGLNNLAISKHKLEGKKKIVTDLQKKTMLKYIDLVFADLNYKYDPEKIEY